MKTLKPLFLAPLLFAIGAYTAPPAHAAEQASQWLDIEVGKSYIHREAREIERVVISDGEIAEVKSLRPGQIQVRGLKVGSTDLWIWYRDDQERPVSYQVTVHRDLSDLIRRLGETVPGDGIRAYPLGEHLVVEGEVPDVETLEQVAAVARSHDPEFVNHLTVAGDHQVQLAVVFAEVSRTGMRELGLDGGLIDIVYNDAGKAVGWSSLAGMWAPGTTTGWQTQNNGLQWALTDLEVSPFTFQAGIPTSLGVVLGMLRTLEGYGLTKVLAQPKLVALSGQQAEFLAGGEIPVPVATEDSIYVDYRDYGIKLVFVPTVLGNGVVDLRVYIEVSDVDESVSVDVGTVSVPGLTVRKASSHLRLQDGMTFAMAGLLSENVAYSRSGVPLLGEIPLIGALFRSVSHEREERELMIFVTPHLVRPLAPGEVPPAPGTTEDNNPNDFEFFLMGMDHSAGTRTAEPTGPIGLER